MRSDKRRHLETKGWRVGTVREFLHLSQKQATVVERYIAERKVRHPKFANNFESGYAMFELGAKLKSARESADLTQPDMARMLRTTASTISRLENHTGDIRLSVLQRYAKALGMRLIVDLREPDFGQGSKAGLQLLKKLAAARTQAASGKKGITHRRMMARLRRTIKSQ